MEFVNKMKKDGKLIMGIGHRVKSVSNTLYTINSALICKWASYLSVFWLVFVNCFFWVWLRWTRSHCFKWSLILFQINNPDMRVQILKDFVKQNFPSTQLLDYALDVEKITTSKVFYTEWSRRWKLVCTSKTVKWWNEMKWQQKAATSKEPDDCFDIQDSEIGLCCQIIWLNTLNRRFFIYFYSRQAIILSFLHRWPHLQIPWLTVECNQNEDLDFIVL